MKSYARSENRISSSQINAQFSLESTKYCQHFLWDKKHPISSLVNCLGNSIFNGLFSGTVILLTISAGILRPSTPEMRIAQMLNLWNSGFVRNEVENQV